MVGLLLIETKALLRHFVSLSKREPKPAAGINTVTHRFSERLKSSCTRTTSSISGVDASR